MTQPTSKHLARRQRWLKLRRKKGRTRPAPLHVRAVNCASVSYGTKRSSEAFARALWTSTNRVETRRFRKAKLVPTGQLPDVVLACECSDFDAQEIAGDAWEVVQWAPIGSAKSALVVAVRRTRGHVEGDVLMSGTPATREGGGIRQRPILAVTVRIDPGTPATWIFKTAAVHAPPPRAPRARHTYLEILEHIPGRTIGGDVNVTPSYAQSRLARRVRGVGVLILAVPRVIAATNPTPVEHGGDHLGVDSTLWPTRSPR